MTKLYDYQLVWSVNKECLFKKILVFSFFILTSSILVYIDYYQELHLFTTQLRLSDIKVDANSYEFLNLLSMGDMRSTVYLDRNGVATTYLPLEPELPNVDLDYLLPVFIENGYLNLNCETNFEGVDIKIQGLVKGQKPYLANTPFFNSQVEDIQYNYTLNFTDSNLNLIYKNKAKINKISNYLLLFGFNGTMFPQFDDHMRDPNNLLPVEYPTTKSLEQYSLINANISRVVELEFCKKWIFNILWCLTYLCVALLIAINTVIDIVYKQNKCISVIRMNIGDKTGETAQEEQVPQELEDGVTNETQPRASNNRPVPAGRFESCFRYFYKRPYYRSGSIASQNPNYHLNGNDINSINTNLNDYNVRPRIFRGLFSHTDTMQSFNLTSINETEKEVKEDNSCGDIDLVVNYKTLPVYKFFRISFAIFTSVVAIYMFGFYILNFTIQHRINELFEQALNQTELYAPLVLSGVEDMALRAAEMESKSFKAVVVVLKIVLNTVLFGCLHALNYGGMYIYCFA